MVDRAAWRQKARQAWVRLRGGELTPWRAAVSVAIGLAIGVTPLWGFHLPLVLAVCLPLRLDAPVAYLAANISLPMVAPVLTATEIEIGELVRTGHVVSLHVRDLHERGLRGFAGDLVVGTLFFAPAMALAGGGLAYVGAKIARVGQRGAFDEAVRRVAHRYASGRGAAYHYVRIKLARDPVAGAVAALGAAGTLGDVVDIGCGRGQLPLLLLELGAATFVTGLDWDPLKVEDAQAAAGELPIHFEVVDVRSSPL